MPADPTDGDDAGVTDEPSDGNGGEATDEPSDVEVVEAASDAAEGVILSRYRQSEVADMDVTVRFEDGQLAGDVYLDAPEDAEPDPAAVAQEAVEAAEAAVDDLFDVA